MRLRPDELVKLAPRLRSYLRRPPDLAGPRGCRRWLRGDLGVSKSLWAEACVAMGREQAAIAIAIVSTKTGGAFPDHAGRVFPRHGDEGQGRRAEPGADGVGLRQATAPKSRRTPGARGGQGTLGR